MKANDQLEFRGIFVVRQYNPCAFMFDSLKTNHACQGHDADWKTKKAPCLDVSKSPPSLSFDRNKLRVGESAFAVSITKIVPFVYRCNHPRHSSQLMRKAHEIEDDS